MKADVLQVKQCLTLHQILREKMAATKWAMPELGDCIRYACGEGYEVLDAEMRGARDHARNNHREGGMDKVAVELADVMIMTDSALMRMDPAMRTIAMNRVEKLSTDIESVDGLVTDNLFVSTAWCLGYYIINKKLVDSGESDIPGYQDITKSDVLARHLGDILGNAFILMVERGYHPLTQVKNKCIAFAMKHGERHKDGYGISVADELEIYYKGFMEE